MSYTLEEIPDEVFWLIEAILFGEATKPLTKDERALAGSFAYHSIPPLLTYVAPGEMEVTTHALAAHS